MERKLIVDAGFHKGEDTKFYLSKWYTVVAIDASPNLVERGKKYFKKYIDKNQLIILNNVISSLNHFQVDFHIGKNTLWNSTSLAITNRENKFLKTIQVPSITLLEVFKKYGVPYYCKIDLEGMDIEAISSLEKDFLPKFISCELECYWPGTVFTTEDTLRTLFALKKLWYNRFKLINQGNLEELFIKKNMFIKKNIIEKKIWFWYNLFLWTFLRIPSTVRYELIKKHRFFFPPWSSGPGPLDTEYLNTKNWLDFNTVKDLIIYYKEQKFNMDGKNLWVDIHATIE